jgi:hypothetical protein
MAKRIESTEWVRKKVQRRFHEEGETCSKTKQKLSITARCPKNNVESGDERETSHMLKEPWTRRCVPKLTTALRKLKPTLERSSPQRLRRLRKL